MSVDQIQLLQNFNKVANNLFLIYNKNSSRVRTTMIQMETILGFDPLSKEIKVFEMDVTPSIAQYILIHHNKDNRKVTNSQINKIAKSIREDGWLRDGQPLTFNVDGNITEGQHRLNAIVAEDVTVPMIIVLGVELNCFTNTAPAKPRRPEDELSLIHI